MLPLVAFCIVGLTALLALAIDIGMIATVRSQCQNAADAAAMSGARTLNGDSTTNYNFAAVPGSVMKTASFNRILSEFVNQGKWDKIVPVNSYTFKREQVTLEIGTYAYRYDDANPSEEGFRIEIPRKDTIEPYSAVRVTVAQPDANFFFGRVLGLTKYNTAADATAVHRPRDVIIVMDLSGSMRFQSLPGIPATNGGTAQPSSSGRPRVVSMNPETVFPRFGHYADTTAAALYGNVAMSTGAELVDPSNISVNTNSGPPVIGDFHQNAAGVSPSPGTVAFTRAPDSQDVTPGGDDYLRTSNNSAGNPYATTANEIFNGVTGKDLEFERSGYQAYVADFKGYTEGPGYWGKTFFIWPPDPRGSVKDPALAANHADNGAKDWRQRFFFKVNASTGALGWLDHTNILFDAAGIPATNSNFAPSNTILRHPTTGITVTENGASVTYTYRINYAAILHWLRNQSPKPFPTVLRAGRIRYYDDIPDPTADTGLNKRWWTTYPLANHNERFWKDYIDFVLGLQGTGAGAYSRQNTNPDGNSISNVPLSALIGNGDYYQWGTVQIKQKPHINPVQNGNVAGAFAAGTTVIAVKNLASTPGVNQYVRFGSHAGLYKLTAVVGTTSITLDAGLTAPLADNDTIKVYATLPKSFDYDDNPHRPRHQLWFGPMTFVDYLGNYNTQRFWWPGNVHEAQCWACKIGINTAISDIEKNHPNDFIGMSFFSNPATSANGQGQHNQAIVPLGRNYQQLRESLWFPPTTVTGTATEIGVYDDDFDRVPRAKGGTAPGMGFMIAYNLLSSSTANLRFYSLPQPQYRGNAGGLGRRGAQRVVIFETDGAPNTRAFAQLGGSGKDSYYKVRMKNPANYKDGTNVEWPAGGSFTETEVYDVVKQICTLESDSPPGFSTKRKPAFVHVLGYGSLFDPGNSSATQTNALTFLQTVAFHGKTATDTNSSSFPDSRRIYGTNTERIERIRQAFTEIMQDGQQVTLIE
ncbi:MAG: pilus assembly protein TadG-related protein [Gemmataceae bacterium]|nr:pilus assembly protein TadG-related protein [Gemmataceae bacterium]